MSIEVPGFNCGVPQSGHEAMVGVCHHCGLPLCAAHVWYIEDPAFMPLEDMPPVYALHCERCARQHHRLLGWGRTPETTRPTLMQRLRRRRAGVDTRS